MAAGYLANWGNDLNDGLSWETAKRSLQGAKDAGLNPINAKGFFNEDCSTRSSVFLTGVLDGTNLVPINSNYIVYGGIIQNLNMPHVHQGANVTYKDNTTLHFSNVIYGVVLEKVLSFNNDYIALFTPSAMSTFHGNKGTDQCLLSYGITTTNILSNHQQLTIRQDLTYSLIINSKIKFTNGGLGFDETTFSYPIGTNNNEKLQDLRNRMAIVYGGQANDYLVGCSYYSGSYNDIFVDADNGNFFLKNTPSNPAIHMSYDGKYIGARPPAAGTFAIADATKTNIDVNGNIIDQSIDANASFNNIIDIGRIVEITNLEALANIAYRNGLSINTSAYVGADINAGANALTNGKQYQVLNTADTGGTIALDDAGATIMSAFDTFTAVDEGSGAGLGFSSVDGLTVREIDISKYDERIEVTSSQTDASLATATPIKLLLHEPPLVNVDGSDEPTYGNADDLFDAGSAVPWKTRYVKINVAIKAAQLYAR